jgi:hypothetical protein
LLPRVIDRDPEECDTQGANDNRNPVSAYIYEKWKAMGVSIGIGATIFLMICGLLLVKSAGAVVDISIRNLAKVGFGVLLILLSLGLLQISLDVLDSI